MGPKGSVPVHKSPQLDPILGYMYMYKINPWVWATLFVSVLPMFWQTLWLPSLGEMSWTGKKQQYIQESWGFHGNEELECGLLGQVSM
jgi:hypothetical protein